MNKILIMFIVATAVAISPTVYAEEIQLSGTFADADWIHRTQGIATITLDDTRILSLEDFKTTNGPDLYVYLATDDRASEFINLGRLQSSNGDQTYEIPEDIDLSKYDKVLIWCKAFSVLFGTAELS